MSTFDLRKVDAVKAKQELDELVIDGIGQLEAFGILIYESHSRYKTEYEMLIRYMSYVANSNSLPDTKFKDVTLSSESVKEYEFKSKHLRVYAIKRHNGKITIPGGFKST